MGVPWAEAVQAGGIMATKLVTNEFVAMLSFGEISSETLSDKTIAIVSVYLVSFANFGTVGIVAGSIKSISEKQGNHVSKFALKLLLGATFGFCNFRYDYWYCYVRLIGKVWGISSSALFCF